MILVKKQDLVNHYDYKQIVEKEKKERETWKWIILLGCLLFQMIPYCVALNLANVFAGSDWLVWMKFDPTLLNLTFTVGALGAAFCAPSIAKWFGKEINMRVVYSIGVVMAMAGFMLLGVGAVVFNSGNHNTALLAFLLWVPTIITQVGVMIFSGLGVNNLISKWWEPEKRGFALGIAFAGGSLGNIWMQQMVGALSKTFGNYITWEEKGTHKIPLYGVVDGVYIDDQWATYIVLGGMGLVAGILITMFTCRKPLPPTDIIRAEAQTANAEVAKKQVLEASPLVTQKYPPYWILAIGYLILQMGTVHAAANGQIIQNTTALVNGATNPNFQYDKIMALGGTLFGVFCLVGNVGGGIVNDKIGPTKSISLAGTVQILAMICLLFSVKTPALVYVYFILAGLSVYVYTSTPAFLCGRLYGPGQSNNQMAILGVFIAIGFAIVNSISGVLMGELEAQTTMLGEIVNGSTMNLLIFAMVCMGVGTIIVATCSAIITNKGIKGLLEYSPTKYTRVILFKHSLAIKFAAMRIKLTKKDFRNSESRIEKMNAKKSKDQYLNAFNKYKDAVADVMKSKKLSASEQEVLAMVFFYTTITKNELSALYGNKNIDKEVESLVSKKLINEFALGQTGQYYNLSETSVELLKDYEHKFHAEFPMVEQAANEVEAIMHKLDSKSQAKVQKLNHKLEEANAIVIDQNEKAKLVAEADDKIEKINAIKDAKLEKVSSKDEWAKYKVDYAIAEKTLKAEESKNKLEDDKAAKIKACQMKIGAAGYVANFNKKQQIDGHCLLVNYYNDVWGTYDKLIDKKICDIFERKVDMIIAKKEPVEAKLAKAKELNNSEKVSKLETKIAKFDSKINAINEQKNIITEQFKK